MNNQAGTVCRLCSRAVICFSDFDRIEEVTKQMLDVLFLKFNWTISKNPVMCNKCATKLQECFDFKSACVGTTNSKSSCVKSTDVHLEEGCLKTEKVEFDVFEAKKSCRFCDKLTESGCLIHLLETKENMFIADMLPKHFPELNLNITEDLVSCETCLESLQRVYSFITKCLYVEENMKNCIEMDDTEGENHIPDNTQKFELKSCDESGASSTNVVVKAEINSEESASSDSEVGLGAKIEEVNIKMEPEENESDCNGINNYESKAAAKCMKAYRVQKISEELEKAKPKTTAERGVAYRGRKRSEKPETSKPKTVVERMEVYRARKKSEQPEKPKSKTAAERMKAYRARKRSERPEKPKPKTAAERMEMYRARKRSEKPKKPKPKTSTERVREFRIRQRQLLESIQLQRLQEDDTSSSRGESKDDPIDSSNITQNIVPEVAYYKCDVCTYKSTNKKYFKSHVKKHTVSSETVIMHKCPICPFTTKRKDTLSNHELTHKDCSEVPIYKCEFCTYETKFRRNITRHMAKHHKAYMVKRTDLSEITTIHKCPICPFTTKRKDTLSNHELTHKDCSEVAIYKCELCTYETKFRRNITRHMSKHKPEETSAHKCEICEYKTKYKSALTNHMLTHKDRTEVTMYKCDRCPFETRYKISFKRHTHHNINPYKCEKCAYETKIKSALVKHVQTHLTTLPLYKCTKCFYDTKREYALYKHMLKHKEKKN